MDLHTATNRLKIGSFIVACEARVDSGGNLLIYNLPKGDGGGLYEIAGINDRYHPQAALALATLIRQGKHQDARDLAVRYILEYTDVVKDWHPHIAVESYLRDCAFNRGPRGAAKIYQRAVGAKIDGAVGPVTKATGAVIPAAELLTSLRRARESYELEVAPPVGSRRKFWKGLQSRWDKALRFAERFL